MLRDIKLNTATWAIIVCLILASFFLAERHSKNLIVIISILTAFKFLMISFQFVEVKNAHLFWKFLVFIFILIYIIGVFVMI